MLRGADKRVLLAGRPHRGLVTDAFRAPKSGKVTTVGAETASSSGTNLTGGGAHVKGSWVELTTGLPFDSAGFFIHGNFANARARYFVDIGLGAGGSEVVKVPDIPFGMNVAGSSAGVSYIPIRIPAGVRIAARCQTSVTVIEITCYFVQSEAAFASSYDRATAYGHVHASTSSVCAPDPHNTANTKGLYDEIVASTTYPIRALSVFTTTQSQDFASNRAFLMDVAVGAASSEVNVIENLWAYQQATIDAIVPDGYGPFHYPIPAGTRLSARQQSTAASDGPFTYVYVLGFD